MAQQKKHTWNVKRLKAFRKSRKLTNRELADMLGVAVPTLRDWLYTDRAIPLPIARLLDCLEKQR